MNNSLVALLVVLSEIGLSILGLNSCSNNPQSVVNQEAKNQVDSIVLVESIKDYYIPSQSNYNKASFHITLQGQKASPMRAKRVIYYVNNNDGSYDISNVTITSLPTVYNGEWLPFAIGTQTVQFTTTEVKMSKSVSCDIRGINKTETYEPPSVLLLMPPATRSIPDGGESKDSSVFTSTWTTVMVGGVSKKAIKVEELWTGWNNVEHLKPPKGTTITYYVKGIGEMKIEDITDNLKTSPTEIFDSLSYEPKVQDKLKIYTKEFIYTNRNTTFLE